MKSPRKQSGTVREWYVYIVRCADGSLYCGITNSLPSRLLLHNAGKGAKYTRSRRPVQFVYAESAADYSAALRREYWIKQLRRREKDALVNGSKPYQFYNSTSSAPFM